MATDLTVVRVRTTQKDAATDFATSLSDEGCDFANIKSVSQFKISSDCVVIVYTYA